MATPIQLPAIREQVPMLVQAAGASAKFAWEEFFYGRIRNLHTRRAYYRSVIRFLDWCETHDVSLQQITPAHIGLHLDQVAQSIASKKQILAGLRHFFDGLVTRHAIALNPASSVRAERYSVLEGKTPEITVMQARHLLLSISTTDIIGLRDKSIIAVLVYTAARVGAVSKLHVKDFYDSGDQYCLHFDDKGGKSREIPVRHDLQTLLTKYLHAAEVQIGRDPLRNLFTTARSKTKQLTLRPMTAGDIGRMVKRRMAAADLPSRLSPHSFRVATITNLLEQGVPLEDVQYLAGHADPRTTRLYDRRSKQVTRNIVERISI
ncbi:MAG: tyrosine-type recombinase/integrase [Pirellulaceae bacterium]|nr:tyrosine-type recombinase/integrase [Pirellulaceae bacterium]